MARKKNARQDHVGAFEAKTRLGELLDRCQRGETIVITRHGHPVARLVPYRQSVDPASVGAVVEKLRTFGKGTRLPAGQSLKEWIQEGRP